jgi:hypothetical protein
MDVTIPSNTLATIYIPLKYGTNILESGKPLNTVTGIKINGQENGLYDHRNRKWCFIILNPATNFYLNNILDYKGN